MQPLYSFSNKSVDLFIRIIRIAYNFYYCRLDVIFFAFSLPLAVEVVFQLAGKFLISPVIHLLLTGETVFRLVCIMSIFCYLFIQEGGASGDIK